MQGLDKNFFLPNKFFRNKAEAYDFTDEDENY